MSITVQIEPKGLKDMRRRIARAGEAGRRASFRGRIRAAQKIVATAKLRVPVDTGTLRSTIHEKHERGPASVPIAALARAAEFDEVAAVADTVYATRQEYEHKGRKQRKRGGVIIAADPTPRAGYMRKSAAKHSADIVRLVAQELDKELA